jgi:hypothetical protein
MTRLSCHTPAPHVPDDEPFWPARNWAHLIAYFQEKVKAHLWWKCQELCLGVCGWRIVTGEPILPVIALRK